MDDAAVADPTPVVEQQGPQNKKKKPRKKKNKQQNADTVPAYLISPISKHF
jgi:hypothetical protein